MVHDPSTLDAQIQEAVAEIESMKEQISATAVLGERIARAEIELRTLRDEVRANRADQSERLSAVEGRANDMDTRIDVLHEAARAQSQLAAETGRFADRVTAQVMWTASVIGLLAERAGVETPPRPTAPPPSPGRPYGR